MLMWRLRAAHQGGGGPIGVPQAHRYPDDVHLQAAAHRRGRAPPPRCRPPSFFLWLPWLLFFLSFVHKKFSDERTSNQDFLFKKNDGWTVALFVAKDGQVLIFNLFPIFHSLGFSFFYIKIVLVKPGTIFRVNFFWKKLGVFFLGKNKGFLGFFSFGFLRVSWGIIGPLFLAPRCLKLMILARFWAVLTILCLK